MKDFLLTASIGLGLIVGTGIAAHAGGNGATGKNAWHQPALTSQQKLQIFPKLQQLQLDHIKCSMLVRLLVNERVCRQRCFSRPLSPIVTDEIRP